MLVKLAMLQSKCSRASKLLGAELGLCLQRCVRSHYNYLETRLNPSCTKEGGRVGMNHKGFLSLISKKSVES